MNLFEKDGVTVLVDYAHNFLSFQKLYESLKADYPGQRIVVVVGCPGGKAQLRRRDIGTLSGQNADYLYLTAEDPQFEDVRSICEEIASFVKPYGTPYEIIEDRAQAVEKPSPQRRRATSSFWLPRVRRYIRRCGENMYIMNPTLQSPNDCFRYDRTGVNRRCRF